MMVKEKEIFIFRYEIVYELNEGNNIGVAQASLGKLKRYHSTTESR